MNEVFQLVFLPRCWRSSRALCSPIRSIMASMVRVGRKLWGRGYSCKEDGCTVEPPNKGHFGTSHLSFVKFLEVKNE